MGIMKGLNLISDFFQMMNQYTSFIDGPTFFIKVDMLWCALVYGASPANYYNFDFFHASCSERRSFVTHRTSQKLMKKYNEPSKCLVMQNKILFAQKYEQFYHRSFLNSSAMTKDEFSRLAEKCSRVICKPVCGGQGKGINCFDISESNIETVYNEIKQLPPCIVESWIDQDPQMSKLNPDSVNPIRVQTVFFQGEAKCISATLTVGYNSPIANASAKALFALIDVDSGSVYTDACDYDYRIYKSHPQTGVVFRDITIPQWEEIKQTVLEAAQLMPEVGYVGWDVALSTSGPVIIEANNDPGYTAYQLPVLTGKHEGTMPIWKKYL